MQRGHHGAELVGHGRGVARLLGKARVGAEEAQRVVAPVVDEPRRHHRLVQPVLHRQQRQRRHAQAPEVRQRHRVGQRGIGAPHLGRQAGVAHRERLDVQLVQHARGRCVARRPVTARGLARRRDAGLERVHGVVGGLFGVEGRCPEHVAVVLGPPLEAADDLARPGVEQQLGRVEAVALARLVRPVGAQPVNQARPGAGQEAVEHAVGVAVQAVAREFLRAGGVEQAPVDGGGMLRPDREVHAAGHGVRAEGASPAGRQGGGKGRRHVVMLHGGFPSVTPSC